MSSDMLRLYAPRIDASEAVYRDRVAGRSRRHLAGDLSVENLYGRWALRGNGRELVVGYAHSTFADIYQWIHFLRPILEDCSELGAAYVTFGACVLAICRSSCIACV